MSDITDEFDSDELESDDSDREMYHEMGLDPDDDGALVRAVKDPARLHLIVAGGTGPITAVCHGWNETSRYVDGKYQA